jgi:manganese/zinc/iron transport system substrate-binding protein
MVTLMVRAQFIHCILGLSLLTLLCGCGESSSTKPSTEAQSDKAYRIVVTTGMVKDAAAAIAGKHAAVENLIGEGSDPHLFSPSRDDVVAFDAADVILYSGLYLEGKVIQAVKGLAENKPVHGVCDSLDHETLLHPAGEAHPDPHVWMDVKIWQEVARHTATILKAYDPAHAAEYDANLATYVAELSALDAYAKAVVDTVPAENRVLVTAHDAFGYFGRAYGVEVLAIQGISTESEAGLHQINKLVDMLVARKISAIFVESSVSDENIKALQEGAHAKGHDVKIGGELFSDAMGAPGTYEGTYVGMIAHNVTTIARALGGTVPAGGFAGADHSGESEE